jgi:hypothetical protein
VIINEIIKLDSSGFIAGNCTTVSANIGAFAGGNLRLLNVKLAQEKQLFGRVREAFRSGNPTIDICK